MAIFRLFAGAGALLIDAGSTGGRIAGTANALTDDELVVGDVVDDSVASDGTVTGSDLAARHRDGRRCRPADHARGADRYRLTNGVSVAQQAVRVLSDVLGPLPRRDCRFPGRVQEGGRDLHLGEDLLGPVLTLAVRHPAAVLKGRRDVVVLEEGLARILERRPDDVAKSDLLRRAGHRVRRGQLGLGGRVLG